MSAAADFARLYRLPPDGALRYLRARGLAQSYDWRDVWQAEHARQFTVSRLAALDVLAALRQGIIDSVDGDLSRRDFMRELREYMARKGWWGTRAVTDPATGRTVTTTFSPARLKLIYDTNTRAAYAAGQWERIQQARATHPYLRYVTQDDSRVRADHAQWHNLTLSVDDPFWTTHYPPNGWGCRCRVVPVSRRDYAGGTTPTGEPMRKTAPPVETRPWRNARTGEVLEVPRGIDPGFAYNVGMARDPARLVADKLAALPPDLAQAARASGLGAPAPRTVDDFIAAGRAQAAALPDPAADPAAAHAALLARLAAAVGTATPCATASAGAGAKLVRQASQRMPDSWTAAADGYGPLYVKGRAGARGWQWSAERDGPGIVRLSDFGIVRWQTGRPGYILTRSGDMACAVHELAHRIQAALPALDALFQELHRRRTAGEPLQPLRTLTGIASYRRDELARPDKYLSPYQGKEYGGRALEVMSMALEAVLTGADAAHGLNLFKQLYNDDREMFDFTLGLLFNWKP